jgi:resuscitation-promoting factor RpfA
VVVTDMNSTNGTVLVLPGQPSFRLHPGTGVPVPPGGVIELGTGVSVTVVHAGGEAE